jgi:hypothetical protein
MSGGHFGDCGYDYYKVSQFADELEVEIVIDVLQEQIPKLRKMAEIMKHIDYLYSGDIGDDGFLLRMKETEAKYDF